MDIILSNTSGEPIYQQIVNQVKEMIISGKMQEEEMLPSIRQLAKDLRISVITTKRAYEDLEREGFIYSIPGKGSFVASQNREQLLELKVEQIRQKLGEVKRECDLINLGMEDVIRILKSLYEDE